MHSSPALKRTVIGTLPEGFDELPPPTPALETTLLPDEKIKKIFCY